MTTIHVNPITEQSFEAEVLAADVPVLVDFTAAWCGPCRALVPILRSLAEARPGALRVATIDTDESPALAARFGVKSVPTVIAFAGGKEVARHVGLTTKEKLLRLVARD